MTRFLTVVRGRPTPRRGARRSSHGSSSRAGAVDLDGLRAHQFEALRETVDRARRLSPFYAERLAAPGRAS